MGANAKRRKYLREVTPESTADGRPVVSKSHVRFARCAPRKVAIVANLLRDKPVIDALNTLQFLHRPSAVPILTNALKSAIANAENNHADPLALVVGEIRVESAPMLKRIRPASMGRAVRVRKRMSHISLKLTEY